MQKRETILLAILAVVVVVAIIFFFVVMRDIGEDTADIISAETAASQTAQKVISTIASADMVLRSDKFLMLTTFGKVPVTVSPDELGKLQLF